MNPYYIYDIAYTNGVIKCRVKDLNNDEESFEFEIDGGDLMNSWLVRDKIIIVESAK